MGSGDAAMVVSFSDQARINQAFTENREQLRRAVREIAPTNRPTSLDEALRICLRKAQRRPAQTTARPRHRCRRCRSCSLSPTAASPRRPTSRRKDSAPRFSPSARPRRTISPCSGSPSSGAAAAAEHRRRPWRRCATSPPARSRRARTAHRRRLIDARRMALEAGQQKDILFDVADAADGLWQLKLPHGDELPADDIAWAVLAPPRTTRGLVVTAGNRYLEAALATDEAKHWTKARFESPRFLKTSDYQGLGRGRSVGLDSVRQLPTDDEPDLFDALSWARCRRATIGAVPPRSTCRRSSTSCGPIRCLKTSALGEVLLGRSRAAARAARHADARRKRSRSARRHCAAAPTKTWCSASRWPRPTVRR